MKRDPLPWIALAALSVFWGYNWVVIKIATHDATPFALSALRAGLGAVCLFIAVAALRKPLRPPPLGPTILFGLVQTGLFTALQTVAVAQGGAGKAAILVYTMPIWVVILAHPFLHEHISRTSAAALVLAIAGLACIVWPLNVAHGLIAHLAAVASAIVWAVAVIYTKILRARYQTDLLSLSAWQMLFGTVPLAALAFVVPHEHVAATPIFLVALAYIVIPGTALAFVLWFFVISRMPAGQASLSSLLVPIVGIATAWLQLGERPSILESAGVVLIIGALALNAVPSASRTSSPTRLAQERI